MRYSRRLAELKEEKAREEEAQLAAEAAEQDGAVPESTRRRQKRATRESAYEVAKRNVVSQLAEVRLLSFGVVSLRLSGFDHEGS